ncbi:MAG: GTP-binding protein, partial [Gemmatimonadaceae bacterium]
MREYRSGDIRNIAVVGHGASGKTTLVDALAFVSGASKRHGSVRDGSALTDFSPEEVERKFSISLGCAHAEWMDAKINLLDTPGYLDFQSDAVAGIAAADGALLVVSGASGVEVGTERMFREAIRRRDPVLVVVSMMDKEHASFESVWEEIKNRLDSRVIPVEVPIGEGANFHGILNLFDRKAHLFRKGTKTGDYTEVDVPEEHCALFDQYYEQLIETIAATDDTLLERYLNGDEISRADAINEMKAALKRGELFPLFCCSSELT